MEKQDIDREAAEWLTRLGDIDRPIDSGEQQEWIAWLCRSPEHVQAYFDVADVAELADEIPAAGRARMREMLAAHRAEPLSVNARRLLREDTGRHFTSRLRLAAAAAVVCIIVGAIGFAMRPSRYVTGLGEQASYILPDGSAMTLNTRSRARVTMTEQSRLVELEGEALFSVTKDKRRPFLVHTRNAVAQAIGTQFNVYERGNDVTKVSVVEGTVRVVPVFGKGHVDPLILSAGQEGEVRMNQVSRSTTPKVPAAVAWKRKTLVFEDESLDEVAAQFNRYNPVQFVLAPDVGTARRLSGTFDPQHPEYFRAYLEKDPSLSVEDSGDVVFVKLRQSR